ncbi:hypothetical protein [Campylobacter sp. LR286c]|uniref:hypothetical protein n=1 Tax=Campylobacter sp. LR286c TaxID=2593545 RepID=UPI001237D9D5|nr:hypothetical protein [Campylobacter sp. LR286c]KAA6227196.1 hypothetical protein FMM57_04465 [Campylobacter sp. LR286c]
MKKIIIMLVFCLCAYAKLNTLIINDLRTDLYSKSGTNSLKKISISLEFEADNLSKDDRKKLIDSVNTVISGFFYEDIFTELGKNNFKKTLSKFIEKKYKIKLEDMYILVLNGIEKFDIEEFKRFLESSEAVESKKSTELKKTIDNITIPQIQSPNVPDIITDEDSSDISADSLNIPKLTPEMKEKIQNQDPKDYDFSNLNPSKNKTKSLADLPQVDDSNVLDVNKPLNYLELEKSFGN